MTPTKITPPDLNSPRVIRGGGWHNNGASWVRAAYRVTVVPASRSYGIGFRAYLAGKQPR